MRNKKLKRAAGFGGEEERETGGEERESRFQLMDKKKKSYSALHTGRRAVPTNSSGLPGARARSKAIAARAHMTMGGQWSTVLARKKKERKRKLLYRVYAFVRVSVSVNHARTERGISCSCIQASNISNKHAHARRRTHENTPMAAHFLIFTGHEL